MDIFAHTLWAGAAYKAANKKYRTRYTVWLGAFWGVFPDLFAFTIPFVWIVITFVQGNLHRSDFPDPDEAQPFTSTRVPSVFKISYTLYNYSHSTVIFLLVFFLVWLIFKRPVWEMWGWLLHILIDIPTHTARLFPTPALWPIYDLRFNGIPWSRPWFMALNYSALLIVYILLWKKKKT